MGTVGACLAKKSGAWLRLCCGALRSAAALSTDFRRRNAALEKGLGAKKNREETGPASEPKPLASGTSPTLAEMPSQTDDRPREMQGALLAKQHEPEAPGRALIALEHRVGSG